MVLVPAHLPLWTVGAALGVLLLAQVLSRSRTLLAPALLAPFWFVYLLVGVRFFWLRLVQGEIPGYFDYLLPDLRVLLQFDFLLTTACTYSGLILAVSLFPPRAKGIALVFGTAAGGAIGWAALEYFGHRTFGATGSDPFAYVQMGIDLVNRGTAAHRFALFPLVVADSIPWFPMVHVGYHLPFNAAGDAITVWSFGASLVYGAAYRLLGEGGLYLVNPFFSLLGVLVSGLLTWELLRRQSSTLRLATTAAVVAIMATSNELVNWAGVTMADTQALVFSTLAMYCALRLYRTASPGWALGSGLCWGFAYFVRHTQLVIVLGMLPLLWLGAGTVATRLRNLALVGITAWLMALPDLWYHETYLGSWLTPESEELALFSLAAIPNTLVGLAQSAFVGSEFGWLVPLILVGIVWYGRRDRAGTAALLLCLGATLAVHLPYPALRLRDLLPEFLLVAFYAALGATAGVGGLLRARPRWAQLAAAGLVLLFLEAGLVRVWNTLPRVLHEPPARFGAMTQAQRRAFDTLAQRTPPNAIVGASLNSGAIELYAHRSAFRPADWCTAGNCDPLLAFTSTAQAGGYELYLLQDNASLDPVLAFLQRNRRVEQVTALDVPLFGDKELATAGVLWRITR